MSNVATLVQPAPTGDGAVILASVQACIAGYIDIEKGRVPLAGQPRLWTEENLTALSNDLAARAEMGKAKYGTYLRAGNGRSAAIDLYQEVCDAIMYSRQAQHDGDAEAGAFYELLVNVGQQLAGILQRR